MRSRTLASLCSVAMLLGSSLTSANPIPANSTCNTNAECIRSGQPLLKPRSPSETRNLRPRQSGNPATTYKGYIQVADMTYVGSSIKYTPIGYLAFVEQDISGVADTIDGAVPIAFPASMFAADQGLTYANLMFDPTYVLPQNGLPNLAAVGPVYTTAGSEGYVQSPFPAGSYGSITAGSSAVPYGEGSVSINDPSFPPGYQPDPTGLETAIWSFDLTYGDLRIEWTDGKGGRTGVSTWFSTPVSPVFGKGQVFLSNAQTPTVNSGITNTTTNRQVVLLPYVPGVFGTAL
ncbi:hypothetical protein EHS25_006791 [Saitozyma podzolica]|uniref:Peptidase A1 domain-containing protein n=1 Tax=Saitozyma podzolica TaxID=1890683 RepID=A0A427XRJ5_9TREE|nr:hypothetical protein EHS25_006791 [Saitozyma podzolica]